MAILVLGLWATGGRADTTWALTFDDEFSGTGVDWTHWSGPGNTYISNDELQAYVPGACTVSGGMLHITASQQQVLYGSTMMSYASGELTTGGYFQQTYGKFEMRARLPAGQGLFPAFWMVSDGPQQSEIDIMENVGQDTTKVYFTVHENPASGPIKDEGSYTDPTFSTTAFHTYTVDWEPGLITWSVDGVTEFQSTLSPSDPMHLLVNMAVGGDWPGPPDSTTVLPATYDIDYIRAYQAVPEPTMVGLGYVGVLGLARRVRR
jgi:beta-glucanase (GH16 family)